MVIAEDTQKLAAKLFFVNELSKAEIARKLNISSRSVGRYVSKYERDYRDTKHETPITDMSREYIPEEDVEYSFSVTPTTVSIVKTVGDEESSIVNVSISNPDAYKEAKVFCAQSMIDNNQSLLAEAFSKFNVTESIKKLSYGRVTVDPYEGRVKFVGDSGREYDFHGVMVERLVSKVKNGEDASSLIAFADKLANNPSRDTVNSVYEFLEACDIRIDEDGDIICYKKVTKDFKDVRTKTFDNSVGAVVIEDRNQVDTDPNNTCSYGLHLCSLNYVNSYGGDIIIKAKLNPADVVAIPNDYYQYDSESNSTKAKLRCCRYEVIGVVDSVEKERSIRY